jgi:hypothetical protein
MADASNPTGKPPAFYFVNTVIMAARKTAAIRILVIFAIVAIIEPPRF